MSRPVKRSLTIRGHRTSVTLEAPFWEAFRAIATARGQSLNMLAAEIDAGRTSDVGLASAIRVFVLAENRTPGNDPTGAEGVAVIDDPAARHRLVAYILSSLPAWFSRPDTNLAYAEKAEALTTLSARGGCDDVGVLTVADISPDAAEIDVLGVLPAAQGQGHGRRLVDAAARRARCEGKRLLTVRTVSARQPDAAYAGTRTFYRRTGFLEGAELVPTADLPVAGLLLVRPL